MNAHPLPPILSIVAKSGSGKTTFIEKLLPELNRRGLRVGVLKHHGHATPFDMPGKDTFRHFAAGAEVVVGASAAQVAVFRRQNGAEDLEGVIAQHMADLDLVLTEGYKRGPHPKIEVHRAARSGELLCDPADLLALVSDTPFAIPTPQFGLEEAAAVADFLVAWLQARA
ncbi:MAG: molybdopterin-guanine dinucleotide biosynthesis protein B [Caldilineales bacterium]|nr:molybdopterin-guanine dinucleotide biosynthesis protein B [Caldilineales bacterium]